MEQIGLTEAEHPLSAVPGLSFAYKGQRYVFSHFADHTNRRGASVRLAAFATKCPDCHAPFVVFTKDEVDLSRLRRRCDACKAPGKRVVSQPDA